MKRLGIFGKLWAWLVGRGILLASSAKVPHPAAVRVRCGVPSLQRVRVRR